MVLDVDQLTFTSSLFHQSKIQVGFVSVSSFPCIFDCLGIYTRNEYLVCKLNINAIAAGWVHT